MTTTADFDWAGYPESKPCQKSLVPFLTYMLDRHQWAGGVTEVRLIRDDPKSVASGYFSLDQRDALVDLLTPYPGGPRKKLPYGDHPRIGEGNVYVTLNPAVPAAYARSAGKFSGGKHTTADADILGVNMVLVDFDPVRTSGVSASDAERTAAKGVALNAHKWLRSRGIDPIVGMSGNGFHLLIPTVLYTDVAAAAERVKRFLRVVRDKFETPEVSVDQTVFNPGRITKVYGSVALKGSHTPDRPHRFAQLAWFKPDTPDVDLFEILGPELDHAASAAPSKPAAPSKSAAKPAGPGPAVPGPGRDRSVARVEAVLAASGFEYRAKDKAGDKFFEFETCPHHTDPDGHTYECCVIVRADGSLAAKCQHDPAAGWQHFKKLLPWDGTGAAGAPPGPEGDPPSAAAPRYGSTPGGLVLYRPGRGGEPTAVPLTNFTARITNEVVRDDGQEESRAYEVEASYPGRTVTFLQSAADFAAMNWPLSQIGSGAVVYPGTNAVRHAQAAIQLVSGEPPVCRVFTHTGWREVGGRHVYLHAGGAIGAGGPVAGVRVELDPVLGHYRLPDPPAPAVLPDLIARLLRLRDLVPAEVFHPLVAAVFRTALAGPDFSLFLVGPTGSFKTELAALVAQFFGPTLTARNLPGSWASTANANEALAFLAKDAVFVIDDFVPQGGTADVQKLNRDADRLLRGQGNATGRGRMRPDTTLRPGKPPRGLIVSTGEDLPRGQSLRARMLAIELCPDTVNPKRLTHRQMDAADGVYARVMAAFIQWLAADRAAVLAALPDKRAKYRQAAAGSQHHRRTPGVVADLSVGAELFGNFAVAAGAFTPAERDEFVAAAWQAIGAATARQASLQGDANPAGRYLELLAGGVATGRCHLAGLTTEAPTNAYAWGWRKGRDGKAEPQGQCIGWVAAADVCLQPAAAYAFAQDMATAGGEPITVGPKTLHKRLHEQKKLKTIDAKRGRLLVRRNIHGHTQDVLHLDAALFGRAAPAAAEVSMPAE